MKLYIVAIPLFDAAMAVQAYRLRDRNAALVLNTQVGQSRMADALQTPALDLVEKLGVEAFSGNCPLFVDINQYQLMMGFPTNKNIPAEKLVCTLPGGLAMEDAILQQCDKLRGDGYTLALDDFPLNGIQSPFFDKVEYLFLDCKNPRFPSIFKAVRSKLKHIRMILTNIPDVETFNNLTINKEALFTGRFYKQPVTTAQASLSPVKINALQLMNQVNEPDFDLSGIAKIIQRDPALSLSLLRFINSGATGVKRKIDSIQGAVAILGQEEVRHWATIAIQVGLSDDKPSEITRVSLIRARFAENLAGPFQLGVFQQQLFITGLFSMIDVVLQKTMAEAMQEVAADERVRSALVDTNGDLFPVMELIYAYERADWDTCSRIAIQCRLDVSDIHKAYVDALAWYNSLMTTMA